MCACVGSGPGSASLDSREEDSLSILAGREERSCAAHAALLEEEAFFKMLSAIFLINQKGEIVIYRLYRDDVSLQAANAFRMQVREEAGEAQVAACGYPQAGEA